MIILQKQSFQWGNGLVGISLYEKESANKTILLTLSSMSCFGGMQGVKVTTSLLPFSMLKVKQRGLLYKI